MQASKDFTKSVDAVAAVCAIDGEVAALTVRQLGLFLSLHDATEPPSVRDLAARLRVTKATVTRTIDRLCKIGLAKRDVDLVDLRLVRLMPTLRGSKLAERVAAALREAA